MDRLIEMVRRVRSRVDAMVARAIITRVNDALRTQRLQLEVLEGEVIGQVEHFQPFGLSFTPPTGAEVLTLAVGGARSHTVALCAQAAGDRPTEAPTGTGGLYTAAEWRLYIDDDGVVHLGAQDGAAFVALASKVDLELGKIATALTDHVTKLGAAGQAGAAPYVFTPASSVAAEKVKAT